jgi:hypothetical protein
MPTSDIQAEIKALGIKPWAINAASQGGSR